MPTICLVWLDSGNKKLKSLIPRGLRVLSFWISFSTLISLFKHKEIFLCVRYSPRNLVISLSSMPLACLALFDLLPSGLWTLNRDDQGDRVRLGASNSLIAPINNSYVAKTRVHENKCFTTCIKIWRICSRTVSMCIVDILVWVRIRARTRGWLDLKTIHQLFILVWYNMQLRWP